LGGVFELLRKAAKMERTSSVVLERLTFPECPRWRDGKLWFSDVHAHRILTLDALGNAEVAVKGAKQPAGLGWAPDGSLLFVRMVQRRLMRIPAAGAEPKIVADLSALEDVQLNDMTVDVQGRAYIGGFGFDINKGEQLKTSAIILVQPDGSASVAADGMRFPNGMVITPDGKTLIAAETAGRCLTAFDIGADGALSNRREWAALDVFPDGICLDAESAVWVASPVTGECVRVREGGEVTDRVQSQARGVYACMLGGDDRRTLYLCTATTTGPELAQGISTGWIESVRADVPGAGLP
jgi:sugar lactone lactonase YvrE